MLLAQPPPTRTVLAPRTRASQKRRGRAGPAKVAGRALVAVWVAFNVTLLGWLVLTSFKSSREIFQEPLSLPTAPRTDNYVSAWSVSELGVGFLNSAVIVGLSAALVVALAAPCAYMLTRGQTRSAGPVTTFFAVGMGVPLQAVIIPIFVLTQSVSSFAYATFGWWDDRVSLLVVYVAMSLPFTVFLLTGFFRSLPADLEEAAAMDGASGPRTFLRVMLPLAQPGLVTAFILNVVSLWNETLVALILITDNEQYTLPQALLGLYQTMQYTSNWGGLFAGVVIVVLPILGVYVWLGRRIVEGLTVGAGK
ncbi:sugar ABC transporter permease [Longispora fulva]|uniref:ABC-type glycerol-3-phosphate transport system permease component n=1 Tax=Longispora fulva TaxID=619741 RepID=A0A8J7GBP3_9ACTN|nr:carbohydrate ABC transporter permease [Longispora fulva]MBG6134546.1 ABC-type glycerol-3-phosphate transport system permease component [Longispora fulva]GIG61752.1 sugar ABC transporter permease [Longispora fulva]